MTLRTLARLLVAAGVALAATTALAADFPEKPIRLVNPYPAGAGAMDTAARVMAEKIGARLGQPVVIDFRPGAGGLVAAQAVARSPKDGYTLYFGASSALGFSKLINKDLGYDPLKDFTPIAMLGTVPVGLFVAANSNIKSLQDLIAVGKSNPESINYGSPGIGTVTHIAVLMFEERSGAKYKHIPYSGALNYWADLVGGTLQAVAGGITGGMPMVKEGRLRLLATATASRSQFTPDVPAVGEFFPGYDALAWLGLVVPSGTPEPVVAKLEGATLEAFRDPGTKTSLGNAGIEVQPLDRKAFAAKMVGDLKLWETALGKAGLLVKP